MVHAYNGAYGTTEVIQHWWNFDPILKLHFDTTPLDPDIKPSILGFVNDQKNFEFER